MRNTVSFSVICIFQVLSFFSTVVFAGGGDQINSISNAEYLYLKTGDSIEKLHRLKTGYYEDLIKTFESEIEENVHLYNAERKAGSLSDEYQEKFDRQLVLIYLMNGKFEVESWKKNRAMQEEFSRIKKDYPELIEEFECKDWSKPMWMSKSSTCAPN